MKTLYEIIEELRKLGTFTIVRMFDDTYYDGGDPVYQFLIYGDVCANKDFDKLATKQVYQISYKQGFDLNRLYFYFSPVNWDDYKDMKAVIDIEDPTEWYLETDNQKLHELADDLMSELVCHREQIEDHLGQLIERDEQDRIMFTPDDLQYFVKRNGESMFCPTGNYTQITDFFEPCVFGPDCSFGDGVEFHEHVMFGENCTFGEQGVFYKTAMMGPGCKFGHMPVLRPEKPRALQKYDGKVTYRRKTYRYVMTVSDQPEPTGLNGGHILCLTIWLNNNTLAHYNEKWIVRPYFNEYEPVFELICEDARQI